MSKERLISKIKTFQKMRLLESKCDRIFSEKFMNTELDINEVTWEQGMHILSDIIDMDFEKFYKLNSNISKKIKRGRGWAGNKFIPDEMMNIIMNSAKSPKRILAEIKFLAQSL